MTVSEMSDYFDVVLQAHTRPVDNGQIDPLVFDEYEKSVFITSSQEDFVSALYNKTGNFEVTEEDRRYLDDLVESCNPEQYNGDKLHIKDGSKFYKLPGDLMYIIYEKCQVESDDSCMSSRTFDVYPCTHDEYNRTVRNPFRGINEHRVLRIDAGENVVELVSSNPVRNYMIRYVKHPRPVVLVDLTGTGLSINEVDTVQGCELDKRLHKRIVEHAVQKAIQSKSIHLNK